MASLPLRGIGVAAIVAFAVAGVGCTSGANTTTTSTAAITPTVTGIDQSTTTLPSPGTSTTATTEIPSTTSTTAVPTTTTKPPATTTTTLFVPEDNEPPVLDMLAPKSLAAYTASYDPDREDFGANVLLSAVVSDPNGDEVTVVWSSSTQGALGTGESMFAFLSTGGFDASQPFITATATDIWGAATSVSVQIIVWIPSDT
ncbi:MAG: hypothetical protein DRJ28_08120 [Actinobacteria bacterium]|nr:MAG: hypothetical protein DRJ28_08120 [Actinomycetota bacterium]